MYGNTSHCKPFMTKYWVKVKDKCSNCLFCVLNKRHMELFFLLVFMGQKSFQTVFISTSSFTLIYQMCLWWRLRWLIRVKKNPLCPWVNPCCTTKPQLVAFGAPGPGPFVISCWNVTAFAFSSQSFAPEWPRFFEGMSLLHDGVHWKPVRWKERRGGGSMINSITRM